MRTFLLLFLFYIFSTLASFACIQPERNTAVYMHTRTCLLLFPSKVSKTRSIIHSKQGWQRCAWKCITLWRTCRKSKLVESTFTQRWIWESFTFQRLIKEGTKALVYGSSGKAIVRKRREFIWCSRRFGCRWMFRETCWYKIYAVTWYIAVYHITILVLCIFWMSSGKWVKKLLTYEISGKLRLPCISFVHLSYSLSTM